MMDTYEKKYKGALARCKWLLSNGMISKIAATDMFRELMDNDENIRKEIINIFHSLAEGKIPVDINYADIFTWLEKQGEQKVSVVEFNAKDWYVSKVDGKIYNAKFMKKNSTNLARKLEIEKAAMSATGIIEQEEWFIKGAEWSDKNPSYISSEKQREQKSADKVEPKFKVGDYVVNDYCKGKVIALTDDAYLLDTEQGIPFSHEHNVHLWSIQDAKDGDVLAIDPWSDYPSSFVAIYKKQNGEDFDSHCFVGFDGKFYKGENGHSTEDIHPATKEQRDLLFQKIHEAGYEWDEEKKELKKIEQKSWSEEDEKMFKSLKTLLNKASCYSCTEGVDKILVWLKQKIGR